MPERPTEPMNGLIPAHVDELRQALERERVRLQRSTKSTGHAARPVELDPSSVGRLSRMNAMASQHMHNDLHAREQAREGRILDALRRVEQGSHGRCTGCGRQIPYGRRLVMPDARACATCRRG